MTTDGDHWFHVEQERKRDRARRQRGIEKRRRTIAAKLARAEENRPTVTPWVTDEFGNMSRAVLWVGHHDEDHE